jgi:uncharacterized protein
VEVPTERVSRFDVATLGNAERTPQGFLRIPAYLTRVGVLEYRRADGQTVRELRPRDEVLSAASLATLSAAPVTDLHPTQMVTPANVRSLQIGHVSDSVRGDGDLVSAHVTIQEAGAIAAVQAGKRRELSCGYQCRIDATPGVYEGQPYDQVQCDIVYNHVALGPPNWGRAGRDVALRVDSADGAADDAHDVFRLDDGDALSVAMTAPLEPLDGGTMELVTVRVDGIDAEVTKQAAQVVEKGFKTRDDALVELSKKLEVLQGRFDAVQAELATTKTALATASDQTRLDAAVTERVALLEQAKRVLPADHRYDGQTRRQIHEAVLTQLDPAFDMKERTDEYVGARFDHAMDVLKEPKRSDSLDDARRVTSPAAKKRIAARTDSDDAAYVPDWMKPLSYTKARTKVM